MAIESSYNQTNFSQNRPIFEDELSFPQEPEPTQNKPVSKRKRILLLVVGSSVLLLLVLIILVISGGKEQQQPEEVVEEQVVSQQNNDPFLRRILQLEGELETADPTKPNLIFPPVNMEIQLDKQ